MSDTNADDQEEDAADFDGEGGGDDDAPEFKVDVTQDKKLNLERRRKIEDKIELYRLRDESGFYDLEI